MISKLTHLLKYGIIGGLVGGIIIILVNMDNHSFQETPVAMWAGTGSLVGMLFSIVVEKWFNETYHD